VALCASRRRTESYWEALRPYASALRGTQLGSEGSRLAKPIMQRPLDRTWSGQDLGRAADPHGPTLKPLRRNSRWIAARIASISKARHGIYLPSGWVPVWGPADHYDDPDPGKCVHHAGQDRVDERPDESGWSKQHREPSPSSRDVVFECCP
jgi:hypothetical protein